MNFKEEAFKSLEKTMESLLKSADELFRLKSEKMKKMVSLKFKTLEIHNIESEKEEEITIYRDVMFMQEYRLGELSVVKESGVVLTENFELARLETVRVKRKKDEFERSYLSEIELSDIPMLALFLESLKIDLER